MDGAEAPENATKGHVINADGTANIAKAVKTVDAKMIYISTDYVFDGQGERPWESDDKCYAPLNVYGQSKLDGELAVSSILEKYFIVRTAWVFGLNGKNFIKTIINVGKTHDTVRVVNDQIGTPTYTPDLARLLVDMAETEKYGYYHATNEGGIAWNDPKIGIIWPRVSGEYNGTPNAEGYSIDGIALKLSDKDQKWKGFAFESTK